MGEQRAAPRPSSEQLPRHGAQPVAARCGARPARGWSPCRESGDPLGWEVTALLLPAHSLCPRPLWSGARGASGVIVCVRFGFFGKLLFGIRDSGWTLHCAVLGSEKPLLSAWGVAAAPGLGWCRFSRLRVWGHQGALVFPGPWKPASRAGTWFCLFVASRVGGGSRVASFCLIQYTLQGARLSSVAGQSWALQTLSSPVCPHQISGFSRPQNSLGFQILFFCFQTLFPQRAVRHPASPEQIPRIADKHFRSLLPSTLRAALGHLLSRCLLQACL